MLDRWSGFFTLTGSAGMTLVGLLFVVVTLGANLDSSRKRDVARAVMTPALLSFVSAMLQGMVALAPWPSDWPGGALFLVLGIAGLIYRIDAVRRRRQVHLRVIEGPLDWIFHNAVPVAASLSLTVGGAGLIAAAAFAPFAIAGSSTLLLISGIYRTWSETLVLVGSRDQS